MPQFRHLPALCCASLLMGCASTSQAPLTAIEREVDLQRFMGDWYVVGSIPLHVPLLPMLSERGAHNGVESYELDEDGRILTTYVFRRGSFAGPIRRFTPRARVANQQTNAEWRMQFLWPFEAAFLIIYLDEDYQHTMIGVPDRSNVWIMSRTPGLPDGKYQSLLAELDRLGYDTARVEAVPQRWPDPEVEALIGR